MNSELHITPDGIVRGVSDPTCDAIAESLGLVARRRASHVWPVHPVKRLAFRVLRACFGERGRVACWCRTWYGPWEVRFAETPHQVEFTAQSRRVCINWEIKTLNERLARDK